MKSRPALLLWGAVLIAAVPVWADGIPHNRSVKDSPESESSAKVTDGSGLELNVPMNAGFRAQPIPAVAFFEANNRFDVWDSKFSKALDAFIPSSSDFDIQPASLGLLDSFEGPSFRAHAGKTSSIDGDGGKDGGRDRHRHHDGDDPSPTPVPEPGSFSLLLLGLAAAGFSARRRKRLPVAV
jgi:PEP-CTERM motif